MYAANIFTWVCIQCVLISTVINIAAVSYGVVIYCSLYILFIVCIDVCVVAGIQVDGHVCFQIPYISAGKDSYFEEQFWFSTLKLMC